ncbi:lipoprotein [Campylobacter insulaenigrae]|uniref:VOC family protein n=1 Tax=Campylobacter insulaenigrae TaxID=260714 RepID=UPI000F6C017A|nr:VOC family protein [Campylobacter insulaenigrae]MCR6591400.1 VOC family protein [Campylobacter insulaenigrae]MCR6592999.1 VOC family protein [Campylobacter insulaenigrae]VEJ55085.1 lipoprotein [Campylobacter insulaenigrae]
MKLNLPIHHIGIACKNIEKERKIFETLGFKSEAKFIDETQGVIGEFIIPNNDIFPQYRLELLSNLNNRNTLDNYLKNRIKMYHIAYESKNIEQDLKLLSKQGIIVVGITEASYFARLCFVMLSNNLLIELVELK